MASLKACVMRKMSGAYNRIFRRQPGHQAQNNDNRQPPQETLDQSSSATSVNASLLGTMHRDTRSSLQLSQDDDSREQNSSTQRNDIPSTQRTDSSPLLTDRPDQPVEALCSQCRKRKSSPSPANSTTSETSSSKRARHTLTTSNNEPDILRFGQPVLFDGEEPSDYTTGPIRIVEGTDLTQHCATLLLNMDLSNSIQCAIRSQRDFAKYQRKAYAEHQANYSFMITLNSQIRELERLARDPSDPHSSLAPDAKLTMLKAVLSEAEARDRQFPTLLNTHLTQSYRINCLVAAAMEAAFIHARLLEPADNRPDTPVQPFTVENEARQLQDYEDYYHRHGDDEGPYEPSSDEGDVERDVEAEVREMLIAEYRAAEHRVYVATREFEEREQVRESERVRERFAAEQGFATADATSEGFDVRWVVRYRELTREVVEAEEALERVVGDVRARGLEGVLEGEDGVGGWEEGCELSGGEEGGGVGVVEGGRIDGWLDVVEDGAGPEVGIEVGVEVDEWESEELVVGDGLSAFAEGKDKVQILRWRASCGR